ncbi:MAG: sigma-54-dependent transcriptional regulator [Spirochaetaceae bacterium]
MRVCIVDDILENAKYVRRVLKDYSVTLFTDPHEARRHCIENSFDILITDQKMPGLTGLELVRAIRTRKTDFVTIVISAYTDSEDLIDAVNSNVIYKYVVKPFSPSVLLQHVHRAAEHLTLSRKNDRLQQALRKQHRILVEESRGEGSGSESIFDVFTGDDPAMRRTQELTQLYAVSDEPVIITGETGTGKELLARVIHAFSPRRNKAFLPLNCSAFQESILESELFGYERGAFTGADRPKKGLMEAADGGTLFLDEIGDLPVTLQPKLLRSVQFGTFIPVGGTAEKHVNVRVVSATNKNLRQLVERGLFREDLYYRINAFHVHLPPLRKRRRDILAIMERIAESRGIRMPNLSKEAREALLAHSFPGNVRELQSVLERLSLATRRDGDEPVSAEIMRAAVDPEGTFLEGLEQDQLAQNPVGLHGANGLSTAPPSLGEIAPGESIDLNARLEIYRENVIRRVFLQEEGNISRTARRLAMSRQGLKNKLREFGLITDRPDQRDEVPNDNTAE